LSYHAQKLKALHGNPAKYKFGLTLRNYDKNILLLHCTITIVYCIVHNTEFKSRQLYIENYRI